MEMTREEKEKAIDALKISAPIMAVTQEKFNDYIQTINKIMDWLEQEPCEDAINRQALLKLMGEEPFNWTDSDKELQAVEDYRNFRNMVEQSPSVKPQEKTGHWISHYDEDTKEGWYECDRCHTERAFNTDYCPDCGVKMVEPQESEEV